MRRRVRRSWDHPPSGARSVVSWSRTVGVHAGESTLEAFAKLASHERIHPGPLERTQRRLNELGRDGPAAGSRAARHRRTKLGQVAWNLALPASTIGVDHLVAWRMLRLAAGCRPNFAHLTLVRGAVEGAAVTRWLCDPAIDTAERIRRAAGVQLADYDQRLRFERRMSSRLGKPTGRARTAAERMETFERLLDNANVKPIQLPAATDLFARYTLPNDPERLAGESLYRLISAMPHAKVWSVFGLSAHGEKIDHGHGQYSVDLSADAELAFLATALAMRVATRRGSRRPLSGMPRARLRPSPASPSLFLFLLRSGGATTCSAALKAQLLAFQVALELSENWTNVPGLSLED